MAAATQQVYDPFTDRGPFINVASKYEAAWSNDWREICDAEFAEISNQIAWQLDSGIAHARARRHERRAREWRRTLRNLAIAWGLIAVMVYAAWKAGNIDGKADGYAQAYWICGVRATSGAQ